jgi:uncharacterized protein (TIGR03382 family)
MRTLAIMVGLCATLGTRVSTQAAYTGLSVTSVNTTVTYTGEPSPTPVTIHKVWANFTNPLDALFVWGGGGGLGPSTINNFNTAGSGPGSGFLNDVSGGALPPVSNAAVSGRDSFFTINVTLLQQIPAGTSQALLTIPGTPLGLSGTTINLSNGGGVTASPEPPPPPNNIALAGFPGDGDTQLRILLMQLAVVQGEHVQGSIGVTINPGALAGATTTMQGQTFASIPAPGALPMLALSGFALRRRRR